MMMKIEVGGGDEEEEEECVDSWTLLQPLR